MTSCRRPSTTATGDAELRHSDRLRSLARHWWSFAEAYGDARIRVDSIITRSLDASTRGDFDECERYARDVIATAGEGKNWTGYEKGLWMLVCAHAFRGDRAESERCAHAMLESATKRNHQQHRMWGFAGIAASRHWAGDEHAARTSLGSARRLLGAVDSGSRSLFYGTALSLELAFGDAAAIAATADSVAADIKGVTGYVSASSRGTLVRAWLWLWDEARRAGSSDAERYRVLARNTWRELKSDAFLVPMTNSALALLDGEIQWREGKHARAQAAWRKGLLAAERMHIPADALHAHARLQETAPEHSPQREAHLREATALRERHGYLTSFPPLQDHPAPGIA